MRKREMTIEEIYTSLQMSAVSRARILYTETGDKVFCTGCGVASRQVLNLKHRRGCLYNLFFAVMYEIDKRVKRTKEASVRRALGRKDET